MHVNTLTAAFKKAQYVWKRTPHSLKKRDPKRFKQAQKELAELRAQAQAGEIGLAYLDEVGFAQAHPNRSACTPVREQHQIVAIRGKRPNVRAALLSSGKVISANI